MRDFRSLSVWHKSHALTLEVYEATSGFPAAERFGLTSQIRRACASVPTNIAEGCGRNSEADFARFLQIAMGSASELEYQLLLSHDLGYLEYRRFNSLTEQVIEVKRMLAGLLKKLRADG